VRLVPDAPLKRELVLLGTYDWYPKRRDVTVFSREYASLSERLPIFTSALPPAAAASMSFAQPLQAGDYGDAIRFGLITDRFEAGHKLKTLAYIAQNQIVLSFADVRRDFDQIPDYAFFIRKLASTVDIASHVAEVAALDPDTLRTRFLEFQRRCAELFTWETVADRLVRAAEQASIR
jgi:hypothetical protein